MLARSASARPRNFALAYASRGKMVRDYWGNYSTLDF
jgi:hypothetical protein